MRDYNELIRNLRDESNCNVLDYVDEAATAIETLVTELSEERHRHDRLQDFEVAQAQELARAKEALDAAIAGQETLQKELARVKKERDAAVEDLKTSSSCMACKHINTHPDCDCECLTCELECSCHECLYGSGFEWRGPQKEE